MPSTDPYRQTEIRLIILGLIVATIGAISSAYFSYKSYSLSLEAHNNSVRALMITTLPVISADVNAEEQKISYSNSGSGIGYVYKVAFLFRGRLYEYSKEKSSNLTNSQFLTDVVSDALSKIDPEIARQASGRRFQTASLLLPVAANTTGKPVVSIPETMSERDKMAVQRFFTELAISVCYTNSSGDLVATGTTGSFPTDLINCGSPPRALNFPEN